MCIYKYVIFIYIATFGRPPLDPSTLGWISTLGVLVKDRIHKVTAGCGTVAVLFQSLDSQTHWFLTNQPVLENLRGSQFWRHLYFQLDTKQCHCKSNLQIPGFTLLFCCVLKIESLFSIGGTLQLSSWIVEKIDI